MAPWSWRCEACGAELGIVEHGELQGRIGLPYRTDRAGTLWVTCLSLDDHGKVCGAQRGWTALGRSRNERDVLKLAHAGRSRGRD